MTAYLKGHDMAETAQLKAGAELDAMIATEVMGWSPIEVGYELLNKPNDPFYKRAKADGELDGLVVGPNGCLMTPSAAKWYADLQEQRIGAVGDYYRKTDGEIIEADEFKPSTDIAAAFEMETALIRMGLHKLYGVILREMFTPQIDVTANGDEKPKYTSGPVDAFDIAHASPESRCLAALNAVRQHKGA